MNFGQLGQICYCFRDNIESGIEEGGAFSVYHKGELVVDLYGGYADVESAQAWSKDSVSAVFSTVKGVSAIIVAMLVDRLVDTTLKKTE